MAFVINAETVRFAGYRTIIKLSNWQGGGGGGEGGEYALDQTKRALVIRISIMDDADLC